MKKSSFTVTDPQQQRPLRRIKHLIALGTAALAFGAALAPMARAQDASAQDSSTQSTPDNPGNWNLTVKRAAGSHTIGNPQAEAKLTEFVSYTCGHCASFAILGDPPLKLVYIPTGRLSLEVRHLIRDPIDWTAAVIAHCGTPDKFPLNHAALMRSQADWLPKAQKATEAQKQRWGGVDRAAARRAIASDLDFYKLMEPRGYSRIELDKCLGDNDAAMTLAIQSIEEVKRMKVTGTPSFALNGQLLEGTHSWAALQPRLDAYFDGKRSE